MIRTTTGWIVLLVAVATAPSAWGQEAPGDNTTPRPLGKFKGEEAAPGNLLDTRLDVLLKEWSKHTSEIKSLYAEFTRTTVDIVWQTKEVVDGSARFLAPNRARLDIPGGDNPEHYVLNGRGEIWEIKKALKSIKVYKLPPEMRGPEGVQDGPLPFLFGAKPEKAKARYTFKILEENDDIVHLSILPKLEEDQKNFARAELWLKKDSYLPVKLFFLETNKNEVTFVFTGIWANIEIDPTNFEQQPVKGWKFTVVNVAEGQSPAPPEAPAKK